MHYCSKLCYYKIIIIIITWVTDRIVVDVGIFSFKLFRRIVNPDFGMSTLLATQLQVLLHITFSLRFLKNQRIHMPFSFTLIARYLQAMGLFSASGMATPACDVTPNRSMDEIPTQRFRTS